MPMDCLVSLVLHAEKNLLNVLSRLKLNGLSVSRKFDFSGDDE